MKTQTTDKREQTQVRIWRSLRVKIDKARAETRQTLADWFEEAAREKLARKGKS